MLCCGAVGQEDPGLPPIHPGAPMGTQCSGAPSLQEVQGSSEGVAPKDKAGPPGRPWAMPRGLTWGGGVRLPWANSTSSV